MFDCQLVSRSLLNTFFSFLTFTVANNALAALTATDKDFMEKAAQGGKFEVEAGKLAMEKSVDPMVRNFAQRVVDDHEKANNELKNIAQKENFDLPTQLNQTDLDKKTQLSQLNGMEFDRQYMATMVQDHQHDLQEFQNEVSKGQSPVLKSWAKSTVPVLNQHLQIAKNVKGGASAQ